MEIILKVLLTLITSLGLASAAAADQRFEFSPFDIPNEGRIVVPVVEGEALSGIAATIDRQTNGALTLAATEATFIGEAGSTLTLYAVAPYSRIDLIGVGAEPVGRAAAEDFGGTASALLGDTPGGTVQILWSGDTAGATAARVAFVTRNKETVKLELERIARNDAVGLDANIIVPLGPVSDQGTRRFAAFRCPN